MNDLELRLELDQIKKRLKRIEDREWTEEDLKRCAA